MADAGLIVPGGQLSHDESALRALWQQWVVPRAAPASDSVTGSKAPLTHRACPGGDMIAKTKARSGVTVRSNIFIMGGDPQGHVRLCGEIGVPAIRNLL